MAAASVELHPEAQLEARAAREWYRERSEAAAEGFVAELDNAVREIGESPERWPKYTPSTRRFLFRRYPYYVVYRQLLTIIQILAVAHGHRRPGYWRRRA
jgi:plasmid stabilization system protein ParE